MDKPQPATTPADEAPQTHAPTNPAGFGDSREHVGSFLYPRVKTTRRRVFKGTHRPQPEQPAAADNESAHPVADAIPITPPEPKTDPETHE